MLAAPVTKAAETDTGGIDVIKVRPNFYMIAGGGGNIGVQIGSDGVVAVNAGAAGASDQVLAALKKITDLPIRYVIDTGADADTWVATASSPKREQRFLPMRCGNAGMAREMTNGGGASILAHDSVLRRMSAPTGKVSAFAVDTWPTEAFFQKRKYLRMNGEGIEVLYQPAAHSDADSFVFFRASDVVVAGDVMDTTRFPVIDTANGGSVQGEIDALNQLIASGDSFAALHLSRGRNVRDSQATAGCASSRM